MLGEPLPEILAPIYKVFQRWRVLLKSEFQSCMVNKSIRTDSC
jgi:hypothetical protein